MPRPWRYDADPAKLDTGRFTAYLAGPGWGFDGRQTVLEELLHSGLPGVLDADALVLLGDLPERPDLGGRTILTPHPGEMARLAGKSVDAVLLDPFAEALSLSRA